MKKVIATVTALSLAFGLCMGLAGCKKDEATNDAFVGVVSEETYESAEAAATAFLENEVSGGAVSTVFVGYEKTGDLSEKEISELNVTDEERKDLERAESGIAKYKDGGEAVASVAEGGEETYSQRVYILIFKGNVYRYYVPKLAVGEWVTKSYYDSVMDVNKYQNCTITINMSYVAWGDAPDSIIGTQWLSEEAYRSTDIFQYCDNTEETEEYYYFKYNGVIYDVYRSGSDWEIEEAEEIAEGWYVNDLLASSVCGPLLGDRYGDRYEEMSKSMDFTFFQKTEDGMKFVFPERYKERSSFSSYLAREYANTVSARIKSVTIKVNDGRIVERTQENANGRGGTESYTLKLSAFGTTKVEIPKEIIDQLSKEEE